MTRINPIGRSRTAPAECDCRCQKDYCRQSQRYQLPDAAARCGGLTLSRDGLPKLFTGLPALRRLLFERAHDGATQRLWRIGAHAVDRGWSLGDVLGDDHAVGTLERRVPGKHLVRHHPQRV